MTGMALTHCILGKYLGVVCHCFPPPLDVPTFAARCLYFRNDARDPSIERWNYVGEKYLCLLFVLKYGTEKLIHFVIGLPSLSLTYRIRYNGTGHTDHQQLEGKSMLLSAEVHRTFLQLFRLLPDSRLRSFPSVSFPIPYSGSSSHMMLRPNLAAL